MIAPRTGRTAVWRLASFAFAAAIVLAWQWEADAGLIPSLYLPSPKATFAAIAKGFDGGSLGWRFLGTVERMIYGWLIASLIGVALGSAIGLSRQVRAYLQPTLEYLRPLPASALIPVAIPILGLTDEMVLAVIGFAALWPTLLATIHGFAAVEPRLYEVGRLLKLNRMQVIWKISLPNALPDIISGMRLSLTYALILSVVGEMLSGREGLGSWILFSARMYKAADLFGGVMLLGLIGYLSALLIGRAERHLVGWKYHTR